MSSHCRPAEPPRRHMLVFLRLQAWQAARSTHAELTRDPIVTLWVESGWPLIVRRSTPDEACGVPVGLPLPPWAGKRRIGFLVQPEDVRYVVPPPGLDSIITCAPRGWWPTLEGLADLALRHSADARVVGSLAWHALTGLNYLTPQSDLDFVLHTRPGTDLPRLAAAIQAIETAAPMRLDGELIRADDAAVNWREFNAGARELLVKTAGGVALINRNDFVSGSATP